MKSLVRIFLLLFSLTPFSLSSAQAETKDADQVAKLCASDIKNYCGADMDVPSIFKCLLERKDQVSDSCKNELNRVPIATPAKLPRKAVPGFAALGGLGLFPSTSTTVNYGGWITPENGKSMQQERLTVQVPVYQNHGDSLALSFGGTSLYTGQPETLSGSGISVPQNLWKAEIGGSYFHTLENDKFEGVRFSIGSASDRPFDGIGVTTFGANAFYSWTNSENSRWIATVFVSNNNPILNYIPIPGMIYLYQTETFVGMFGFPFTSMVWMPKPLWMFTLSIFGPTVNSEIAYGNPKVLQAFTGYSWIQQSYLRVDRPDDKDRLYYAEMHLPIGVRFPIGNLVSELSAGYTFDRSFYEGTSFGKKEDGQVDIPAGIYYAWNLRMAF